MSYSRREKKGFVPYLFMYLFIQLFTYKISKIREKGERERVVERVVGNNCFRIVFGKPSKIKGCRG